MSYTKHNFQSGAKLYASELNEMDEQIFKNEQEIETLKQSGTGGSGTTDVAVLTTRVDNATGDLVGFKYVEEYVPTNTYELEAGDIEADGTFNNLDWLRRKKYECIGRKKVSISSIQHSASRPTICCYDAENRFLVGFYTENSDVYQKLECITPLETAYIYVCTSNEAAYNVTKIYNGTYNYVQRGLKFKYTNIFIGSRYDKYFSDFDNYYHNMKSNQNFYKSNLISDNLWLNLGYNSAYRIECIQENTVFKTCLRFLNRYSPQPLYSVGDTVNIRLKYRSVGEFYMRLRSGANTISEETLNEYGDILIPNSNGEINVFDCSFTIDELNENYGFITPQFVSFGNNLGDYIEFVDFTMLLNEEILDGCTYLNKCEISEFSDLSIMYFGDSITASHTYSTFVNAYLKPKSFINLGVVGASLVDNIENQVYDGNPISEVNTNTAGNQVQKAINNNYEAPDIILFAFGTNDRVVTDEDKNFESQFVVNNEYIPLTSVDRTTFGGAMRYCMEKLHELYPNAQVFIMTPIQSSEKTSGNGTGWYYEKLKPKADLIKSLGNRMSIPVIDCFNECRIYGRFENKDGNGEYLSDGLHLNEQGSIRMGKFITNEIRNRYIF